MDIQIKLSQLIWNRGNILIFCVEESIGNTLKQFGVSNKGASMAHWKYINLTQMRSPNPSCN
jgi:hypothetical protein